MGITPNGQPVYVEFKAPNRRSTLRPKQREFLLSKIRCYGFAVVVDSVNRLRNFFHQWEKEISMGGKDAGREFLVLALPQKKAQT
jgi:hypothetical protein